MQLFVHEYREMKSVFSPPGGHIFEQAFSPATRAQTNRWNRTIFSSAAQPAAATISRIRAGAYL